MTFTVNTLDDVLEILRQRPEWREKLRTWLLEEELRAKKRTVAESPQGQIETTGLTLNEQVSVWNETVNTRI